MKRSLPPCYRPFQTSVLRNDFRRLAIYILLLTYFCYTFYHASRKPLSIVKTVLHRSSVNGQPKTVGFTSEGWKPFDSDNWSQLLGGLEYIYLFVYAVSMILSGFLAERVNLRYFLSIGMFLSGVSTFAFGLASYFEIHYYSYFVFIQVFSGLVQASGWPAVVTLVGNWWGKSRRGLIMGLWNSHTSLGNIIGSVIAGIYVETNWGASFYLPGLIMMVGALVVYLTVIEHPNMLVYNSPSSDKTDTQIPMSGSIYGENIDCERSDKDGLRPLISNTEATRPISFIEAILLPSVFTYSLLLFFTKLVSYTFLYWLPNYLTIVEHVSAEQAAKLSVLFDVGGIIGGVLIGWFSDSQSNGQNLNEDEKTIKKRALACLVMLAFAAPLLLAYRFMTSTNSLMSLILLTCCGSAINGPYALVTTAVSADLGTQSALLGRTRALATITSIIDGMGSLGAALGPLLTGLLVPYGWSVVFAMLITSDLLAMLMSIWIVVNSSRRQQRRTYYRLQSTITT
ncbi:putative solute carrier family 37 member 2 (glycerol-3-phosphate transporter [Schistosoma mansoni]|uniref:putative solute carrier family 37 member 2 (glycerol-3-phosphate transporter n=2 Tax=Schistosoma mansoni TaxID=6183 RepID=UPI00022DC26F|nr:putative solute carrier family 37 member 2 (glycerol-3-phosphate transporter [Schistosoma mansoni]|eukprot:XP_018648620.1 putative solute carrier family 37 member 2 (glycerol-3-phosphate transporter [Schistosoma mansoni]